ncbi:MAG: c-type cytochrome [Pseudomonadota bacterium]|nr:c-type cytochrome [Pseudomonadota bacterium]
MRAIVFFEETKLKTIRRAACLLALPWLAGAAYAQTTPDSDLRAAGVLASNCANCHGTLGNAQGAMPSLAGQQKTYIVEQMRAFRDGKRPATIMHQLAKGYTDQQVELIADFFSRQKPAR